MEYYVVKRNGKKEEADITKIIRVLQEANDGGTSNDLIIKIANEAIDRDNMTTNEIRDRVETLLIKNNCCELAKNYIIGCYKEQARRNREQLDKNIMGLINQDNEDLMNENANKNPTIVSTQRDLIAGEVSKDIASRFIFTADVMEAHNKKAIHIHK